MCFYYSLWKKGSLIQEFQSLNFDWANPTLKNLAINMDQANPSLKSLSFSLKQAYPSLKKVPLPMYDLQLGKVHMWLSGASGGWWKVSRGTLRGYLLTKIIDNYI